MGQRPVSRGRHREGRRAQDQAFGGFIVPYSPEYLRFRSNRRSLQRDRRADGRRDARRGEPTKDDDLSNAAASRSAARKPMFDWFLIALAFLMPLDVGHSPHADRLVVRSSRLFVSSNENRSGDRDDGRAARSASRTSATELQPGASEAAAAAARKPSPKVKPTRDRPSSLRHPPPEPRAAAEKKPTSTTERLLELKRKQRQQEQK